MAADFIKRLNVKPTEINLRRIREFHDIQETLLFVWLVDKIELKAAFSRLGLQINSARDLQRLYDVYMRGWDIRGSLTNSSNIPIKFDLRKLLLSINTTKVEIQRALDSKTIKLIWL